MNMEWYPQTTILETGCSVRPCLFWQTFSGGWVITTCWCQERFQLISSSVLVSFQDLLSFLFLKLLCSVLSYREYYTSSSFPQLLLYVCCRQRRALTEKNEKPISGKDQSLRSQKVFTPSKHLVLITVFWRASKLCCKGYQQDKCCFLGSSPLLQSQSIFTSLEARLQ